MFIKKSLNFFIVTSLFFSILFFLNFNNYIGSKFLFFIYYLSSFGLLLTAIKKNNSAFEFFTYFFLLFSFFFKFNCILYFKNIKVTEGDFDLAISNYDNATFVIVIAFLACICASYIKDFINKNFVKKTKFEINNAFIRIYRNYRILIIGLTLTCLILIWGTNFYYKIYSKGLVNDYIQPLVIYFYSWCLSYGLSSLVAVIIYIDFFIYNKKKIFLIGLFESFFTQMSVYSRSFLLSFIAYLRGFLLLIDTKKLKFSKKTTFVIIFLILILFYLSIYSAGKIRSSKFYESDQFPKSINYTSTFSDIFSLSVNRWVGIDALLSVSQSKNLNFNFFLLAWQEEKFIKKKSFYIDNFFTKFKYSALEQKNLNLVVTPGIVAFLYYSGSAFFVFFGILILVLICSFIELLFYHFSFGNIILANIIGYALSIRFIHFGYIPANTINFILSFCLTFFFIYFLKILIQKKI